ncbi:hypothetical protein ACR6C2_37680 [Streptomyces sp. INA 01156]
MAGDAVRGGGTSRRTSARGVRHRGRSALAHPEPPADRTEPLLADVPAAFHGGINDVLLTGLALAVAQWRHRRGLGEDGAVLVDLEGHGREDVVGDVDLSRTVGWFTTVYPVRLDPGSSTGTR